MVPELPVFRVAVTRLAGTGPWGLVPCFWFLRVAVGCSVRVEFWEGSGCRVPTVVSCEISR